MSYNSVHKGPKILAKMSVPATHTMKQFCNSSSPKAMVSSYCCQLMVRCFSANTPLFTFSADTLMHLRKTLLSLWELGLFNWYNYKQVDHYEEMYNETGCHEFKRMQPTEVVRVFLRIKVLSLQREFVSLVSMRSFHRMHDEEREKMANCC